MAGRLGRFLALIALAIASSGTVAPTTPPTTHVVKMLGGGRGGFRMEPREITIGKGDTVRFELVSGGPHNVAFNETTGDARARLLTLMKDQIGDLSGPLLIVAGDTYSIPFTAMPSGKYPYVCIPHFAMGTMGTITVK